MANKFQVPQFVEVEDKIFWRLTLKQFIYLAGGGGLSIIIFLFVPNFLPTFFAIVLIIPVVGFSLALAFYRYNNRPFIFVVESAFQYLLNARLYIWRKVEEPMTPSKSSKTETDPLATAFVPKLSDSKLKELTWSLDTKEAMNPFTQVEK
jgi:hypothetical protein